MTAADRTTPVVYQYSLPAHTRNDSKQPLVRLGSANTSQNNLPSARCGKPGRKERIPAKDVWLFSIEIVCLVAALLIVFESRLAIWLGQINQLIGIGFVLAVMAMCLEGLVLRTALIHTANRSGTSIQDLDALMRKDPFSSRHVHIAYRILLLFLLGLPLLLSIAYKRFVGGESTVVVNHGDGLFGFSSTPGKQRIGDGLSILSDVYVPFWISPGLNRTYGFNMYIPTDNKTGVIVDSPFPSYLTGLQSSLNGGESLTLSATVNATLSEMVNPTAEERSSDDFWTDVQDQFDHPATQNGGNVDGANNAMWAGMSGSFLTNFSVMYFSAWNTTRNETFYSEAIRTEQSRRRARATWLISSSNITLVQAELIPNSTLDNQLLLQNNAIGLQEMFSTFLGEYDWHNRAGAFDFPYPDGGLGTEGEVRYFQPVNTVPPLAATMAWARITSLDTVDRPGGRNNSEMSALTGYSKGAEDILTVRTVPTLRRDPLLVAVLVINPALFLVCVLIKATWLYGSPMGDDANIISLLAAADGGDLGALRGASLTGKLNRKVLLAFHTERDGLAGRCGSDRGSDRVVMTVDGLGPGQEFNHKWPVDP
ncbi:hypothetical protein PV08_11151 [Exophiala spinifera]|uniref:Uncharacterized protein n=1 Tax=Exophiala spinifera TaxID=91928 RepID=A0A0D2AUL0_9EURO|nr:uncharacterized protein PV08_11151 [Exophiala spinifera]KIW10190.1 hypothetical protein PV08_11151 [Exophiala spinifera]